MNPLYSANIGLASFAFSQQEGREPERGVQSIAKICLSPLLRRNRREGWFRRRFVLTILALTLSISPAQAQASSTNIFPPWPQLADVISKYETLPLNTVQLAADNGDLLAQHYLGYCYASGLRVAVDLKVGIAWYEKALRQGYLPSGFNLGLLYLGQSPYHDAAKAVHYFQDTGDKGFIRSELKLADIYLAGEYVEQDEARGLELVQEAADHDSPEALSKLADLYACGIGEPRDENDRPFVLLCRAIRFSPPTRQQNNDFASVLYRCETGLGTDRDLVATAQWHCRAAMSNIVDYFGRPEYILSDKFDATSPPKVYPYFTVLGSPQLRPVLAAYLKAAARRDAGAAQQLGTMYLTGRDAPRNAAKAWPWFKLAAQYGAPEAAAKISQAEAGMTTVELEQDQQQFPAFLDELKKVAAAASRNAAPPENP